MGGNLFQNATASADLTMDSEANLLRRTSKMWQLQIHTNVGLLDGQLMHHSCPAAANVPFLNKVRTYAQ